MEFNPTKFLKQEFQPRTAEVNVDSLYMWFNGLSDEALAWFKATSDEQKLILEKGGKTHHCAWEVRGLTGSELARVFEAEKKAKTLDSVIEAIGDSSAKVEELKIAMGLGDDTPIDIQKRLEQLTIASINPVITKDIAIRLAEKFPIEFYMLTTKISALTGLGMDVKK